MKARLHALLAVGLCLCAGVAQAQTYSAEAIADLRFLIEEEKLARDVYLSFSTLYSSIKPFQNIPKSEQQHYTTLLGQAGLAGVDVSDITALPANTFLDPALQSLFTSLLAQGSISSFAALTVGRNIEIQDIEDLTLAMTRIPSSSPLAVAYGQLRDASYQHLNAFNHWLSFTPAPPVPEPETYALMLAGLSLIAIATARRRA